MHQPGILYLAGLRWTSPTIVCTQNLNHQIRNSQRRAGIMQFYHLPFSCAFLALEIFQSENGIKTRTQNSRCPGGQVLVTVGFLSNILKKDQKLKFRDDFSPFLLLIFPFQRCFAEHFCPMFRFRCHIQPLLSAPLVWECSDAPPRS